MGRYLDDIEAFASGEEATDFYNKHYITIHDASLRSHDPFQFTDRLKKLLYIHMTDIDALHEILRPISEYINQNPRQDYPLAYYTKMAILYMLASLYMEKKRTKDQCFDLHTILSPYIKYPEWHFFQNYCHFYKIMNDMDG